MARHPSHILFNMGIDAMFAVEVRSPDGTWRRAEPLVHNPYWEYPDISDDEETGRTFPTLNQLMVHEGWSFEPRDTWLIQMNWPVRRPLPEDVSIETLEFLDAWTEKRDRFMLLLQDLEEVDWLATYDAYWMQSWLQEKREAYVLGIRTAVLERLRRAGGPETVRILCGYNV